MAGFSTLTRVRWLQVHDRMTECVYPVPLQSFASDRVPDEVTTVPVLAEGRAVLERMNAEMGLAFDDWDLDYYTNLFRNDMKRDPTNVELFDIAQSNSEHSRHWFFKANLVMDGEALPYNLWQLVGEPLKQQVRISCLPQPRGWYQSKIPDCAVSAAVSSSHRI